MVFFFFLAFWMVLFLLSSIGLFLSVLKVIILSASDLISRSVLLRSLSMSATMSSYGATMVFSVSST